MDSEPRVTEADREFRRAVLSFIVGQLERPCAEGDMIDERNDKFDAFLARHRQAALIEGARVGLEHAKSICADYVTFCGAQPLWPDEPGTTIGLSDPAAIIARYLEKQG